MPSLNGSTPRNGPEFVDEDLRVTPHFVQDVQPISPPGGEAASVPEEIPTGAALPGPAALPAIARVAVPDFTEDDLLFLTSALWSLPNVIWERVPVPDAEKLGKWNHQFYRYCVKKGINPYDFLFDELPLAIATVSVAGDMWKAYKASAPPEERKAPIKGAEDWQHEKDLASQKARDLQAGAIQSAPGGPGGPLL